MKRDPVEGHHRFGLRYRLLLALCWATAVACAPPPPPPRAPSAVVPPAPPPEPVPCTPLYPRVQQSSLLEHVPAGATFAAVVRRNAMGWYERAIAEDKLLAEQLRGHYTSTLGVDFTGLQGLAVVGFTEAGQTHLATFLHAPSLAVLKGEARGVHRDIPLVAPDPNGSLLGASLREGVWLGDEAALKRVLDHELDHLPSLFFDVDGPDVDLLAYLRFDAATEGTVAALSSAFGVEHALFKLDAGRKATLILKGKDARIEKAQAALETATQTVLGELANMAQGQAPADVWSTAASIFLYHQVRRFGEALKPRVVGVSLVSEYEFGPWLASAPLGAAAAAITVPAVLEQVTRGKTGQARTELTRVAAALATYHDATKSLAKKKGLPPVAHVRIGRTPRVVPCANEVRWDEDEMAAWQELGYAPNGPMRYSLEVGPPRVFGRREAPEVVLMVRAEGDLDCDGTLSRFDLLLQIDEDGRLVRVGDIASQNEAE